MSLVLFLDLRIDPALPCRLVQLPLRYLTNRFIITRLDIRVHSPPVPSPPYQYGPKKREIVNRNDKIAYGPKKFEKNEIVHEDGGGGGGK